MTKHTWQEELKMLKMLKAKKIMRTKKWKLYTDFQGNIVCDWGYEKRGAGSYKRLTFRWKEKPHFLRIKGF